MRYSIMIPFAALALTACGASADDGKTGTDISIDATTDEGEVVKASSDGKTGEVEINAPGFKASIAMPKVNLDSENFDMDGAKLYPGSKILSMKVDNVMRAAGTKGDGGGTVRIRFDSPAAPDVPTMAEAGYPGVVLTLWNGMLAPAGTPAEIIARLNAEIIKVAQMPEVRDRLAAEGTEAFTTTPPQMTDMMRNETAKWAKVIKTANIALE